MNRREAIRVMLVGSSIVTSGCSGVLMCRFPEINMRVDTLYKSEVIETVVEQGQEVRRMVHRCSFNNYPMVLYLENNQVKIRDNEQVFEMIERFRGGCERRSKISIALTSNITLEEFRGMLDNRNLARLSELEMLDKFFIVHKINDIDVFVASLRDIQNMIGIDRSFLLNEANQTIRTTLRVLGNDFVLDRMQNSIVLYPIVPNAQELENRYGREYSIFRSLLVPIVVLESVRFGR